MAISLFILANIKLCKLLFDTNLFYVGQHLVDTKDLARMKMINYLTDLII